jgi:hypothetical protein
MLMVWKTSSRRDLGDFQTPVDLVAAVLKTLGPIGTRWPRVLEPTCGQGNFIDGLLELATPPREIRGFEIQQTYCELARQIGTRASSTHVEITQANLFDIDLRRDVHWNETGPLLVIGNPPWITNAELGSLESNNLPRKVNMKGLRGIDAMTGESNFDITEYIWIKLIQELAFEHPTIALLCKTAVARNILRFAASATLPLTHATIRKIDAHTWFDAAVDACLFCVTLGLGAPCYQAEIYADLVSNVPETIIGVENGQLVADIKTYRELSFADGSCTLTWRQGLKHDAASVMEIVQISDHFQNKHGEILEIESEHTYPLLKSTDLFHQAYAKPHRSVIVTQRRVGEDTRPLERIAPRLWRYLTSHIETFKKRKSSIYRGSPPFAMFGIGEYSFAPYKVAISGLHKTPRFRAVGSVNGQPVMFDDTCYFVACSTPEQAALLVSLLNDPICLNFMHSLVFWDSKRPITKKVLQRINLKALLNRIDRAALLARADVELNRLKGNPDQRHISWPADLEKFFGEPALEKAVPLQMTLFEAP